MKHYGILLICIGIIFFASACQKSVKKNKGITLTYVDIQPKVIKAGSDDSVVITMNVKDDYALSNRCFVQDFRWDSVSPYYATFPIFPPTISTSEGLRGSIVVIIPAKKLKVFKLNYSGTSNYTKYFITAYGDDTSSRSNQIVTDSILIKK